MSELPLKIAEWLDRQGYPLEMRAAEQFSVAGFDVTQSAYYIDPETKAARETDIVAVKDNVAGDAWVRWMCVVECKSGRSAPWVLFGGRGEPLAPRIRVRFMGASRKSRPYLARVSRRLDVESLPLFNSAKPPAYGMVQALRESNNDVTFAASTSVAKAASFFLNEFVSLAEGEESIEMVWPVIVIEAPLFEATLDSTGKVSVTEIEQGTMVWRHPTAGEGITTIDVVTVAALPQYAASVAAAADLLLYNTNTEVADTVRLRERNRETHVDPPTA